MKHLTALAVLLVAMLSINACDTLLSKPEPRASGTGTVQVALPGAGARTIMPLLSGVSYHLVFSSEDYDDVAHTVTGGGDKSFAISQGVWDLAVEASVDGALIARGGAGPILVLAGKTVAAKVLLDPVNVEDGTGTLDYTVNYPSDTETGALKLVSFPGGNVVKEEDLLNNPSSIVEDIPAGYYQLFVSLVKDSGTKAAGRSDIVHIYRDQKSEFEWTFADRDFAEKRSYFISLDEMRSYLEAQPGNDAANPLSVKLAVNMAELAAPAPDNAANIDSLGRLYAALAGKYVEVDLSDSIGDIADGSLAYGSPLLLQRANYDRIVKITLPSALKRIGNTAFARADMEIVCPASLKEIGNYAFAYSAIDTFDFSSTALEEIGAGAFTGCSGITSLVIPRSLRGFAELPYVLPSAGANPDAGTPQPANPFPAGIYSAISFDGTGPLTVEEETLADGQKIRYWMRSEADGGKTLFYYYADFASSNGNTPGGSAIEITVPNGVTKLGDAVFYYSSNLMLKEVALPPTLEHIGDFAFRSQSQVVKIDLPTGLKTIGRGAFRGCTNLEFLNVGNTQLESIGAFALLTGTKLWQFVEEAGTDNSVVVFPASLKTIGDHAFGHDLIANVSAKFTKVDLSKTKLTGIEAAAFARSTELKEVVLPATLKSIGDNAFKICPVLETINFPPSLERLGATAFAGVSGAATVNKKLAELDLSQTKLTRIPASSFEYNAELATVRLPPTLKSIEDYAFRYDGKIADLDIPAASQLEYIGKQVFYSVANPTNGTVVNTALVSLVLPDSLKALNDTALENLKGLRSLTVPANLYIGADVFKGFSALEEIHVSGSGPLTTDSNNSMLVREGVAVLLLSPKSGPLLIPEGIVEIPANMFQGNADITSLTFPETLKRIGNYAFYSCGNLTEVSFPASLEEIGNNAFAYCSKLNTAITFPTGSRLISIGNNAFADCGTLPSISFPASLERIGDRAFSYCTGLSAAISFPEDSRLVSIGATAFALSAVPSMDFSNTVLETLGTFAFMYMDSLVSIEFPATVTSFGDSMFGRYMSPGGNLAITLRSATPPAIGTDFISAALLSAETDGEVYIYVPSGSVEAYKSNAAWSQYKALITPLDN